MGQLLEIRVPDIGDFDEVEVVEILVAKGDRVDVEDPLVSIESDKATMEIPSTAAGVVVELQVAEGDRVSEGSLLVVIDAVAEAEAKVDAESPSFSDAPVRAEESKRGSDARAVAVADDAEGGNDAADSAAPVDTEGTGKKEPKPSAPRRAERTLSPAAANPVPDRTGHVHASPLVRRYARELGVPLRETEGTGEFGRVLVDDLKRQVRDRFAGIPGQGSGPATGAAGIPPIPAVDHAAFGPVREEKLTRIQKVSGPNLQRSWLNVPHVTQHEDADLTLLERFRRDSREAANARGLKLSPLLFVMKAVVVALDEFPSLRASLAPEGDRLLIKDYFHLGVAVDTDQGLVVPVVRDVDRKGIFELATEVSELAERARARKLGPDDLRGACFTISSLGGIGGTAFTPIVNAPEVAILGLSKTRVRPVWEGPSPLDAPPTNGTSAADSPAPGRFVPRLVLPMSLSYDHRVVDGAVAVRFTSRLSTLLSNPVQLLL